METTLQDRIRGSLIGGATGDALGYPVEFMSRKEILARYGSNGITKYDLPSNGKAVVENGKVVVKDGKVVMGKGKAVTRTITNKPHGRHTKTSRPRLVPSSKSRYSNEKHNQRCPYDKKTLFIILLSAFSLTE